MRCLGGGSLHVLGPLGGSPRQVLRGRAEEQLVLLSAGLGAGQLSLLGAHCPLSAQGETEACGSNGDSPHQVLLMRSIS